MHHFLIINADDFGLSRSVNEGIAAAHHAGTVTSTSLMVNMPGFYDAVSLAKAIPSLGVGLHFNLTYGSPISEPAQVHSLIRHDRTFNGTHTDWIEQDVERELYAQYRLMISNGLAPTHVDSHCHIHFDSPVVYRVLKRFAQLLRLPLRVHPDRPDIELPYAADHLIMHTYDRDTSVQHLISLLDQLPCGVSELLCHPGYIDADVRRYSQWIEPREAELRVFTDASIMSVLQNRPHIRLIHYGQLAEARNILVEMTDVALSTPNQILTPAHEPRTARSRQRASRLRKRRGKKSRATRHNSSTSVNQKKRNRTQGRNRTSRPHR
ncbi:carbohydrate deacetylase [Paenibacillus sp. OSY-SE]|uniref:carbohydrate deacetylase n=1 Tax=Paenibacillus sp. OSY-SE TaxID=1196323 RepID=UPI00031040D0|nr:ChbG/HpnK family deacetylase [Paenibacillus sp. OSY-SE]